MLNLIVETNGDILGLVLFILLIHYFAFKLKTPTAYTTMLLVGCVIGFVVDFKTVYDHFWKLSS